MPAGMNYSLTPIETIPEYCNVESIFRRFGGFNLVVTNLVAGSIIPPLAPLAINFSTRLATVVKNVMVAEAALANATAIKVKKDNQAYVGMYLGNGTKSAEVTAMDRTNANYDTLTITLGVAVALNEILMETAAPAQAVAAVKGVYTLTIGTVPAADDTLTVNSLDYVFAAAAAEGKIMIGADKIATAANLQDVLEHDNPNFLVKANGAKLVFTQKVAGVGTIPAIVVTPVAETGTLAATIAQTTAGVVAVSGDISVPLNVCNGLNYASVKVEAGASVTAIGGVMEIVTSELKLPICSADKANLGARYDFI